MRYRSGPNSASERDSAFRLKDNRLTMRAMSEFRIPIRRAAAFEKVPNVFHFWFTVAKINALYGISKQNAIRIRPYYSIFGQKDSEIERFLPTTHRRTIIIF